MPIQQGIEKASLQSLGQIKDRMTFLYVEHCIINKQDGSITVTDARGTVHVPAAMLSVLLLGPGTSLTHRAVELISDSGMSIIWVGEHGVRYYAHGHPLTHSSQLLKTQAKLVSNTRTRLEVARKMYQIRFPDEDVSGYTMQQLRGREGARIRSIYRKLAKETGIEWSRREFDPDNYDAGNAVNKALSAAHACLYGIAHSAIVALGCSSGLGFVHDGHERSFVYDIADLYKAEITIPIAFHTAASADREDDIGSMVRRQVRDAAAGGHILERTVRDIRKLLMGDDIEEIETNVLYLWDDRNEKVSSGISYNMTNGEYEVALETCNGKIVEK